MGYRLWRSVGLTAGWNYTLYRRAPEGRLDETVERCWTVAGGCAGVGNDNVAGPPHINEAGIDIPALVLHVDCNPGPTCSGGGPSYVKVSRLQVDLTDRIDPTFAGPPSGDLLDTTKPLSGVRSVSFSASDQGGGVYSARLEVDGQAVASSVVDDNGGRCALPFRDLVPCKATASGTLALDTATLVDGAHSVRLVVADATQTNTVTYGPVQVTTANQSIECEPGAAAELAARFATTRRTSMTRRGGGAFTLTGALTGATAGRSVVLLTREARTGAPWIAAGSAVTVDGGAFRVAVPAGPSRTLRVAYRPAPTARLLRCAKTLRVRVPARVSGFSAKRTGARRYRLSGRLLGGAVPQGGALIEFQGFERGAWRRFDTVRSSSTGRFSTAYRFRLASVGRTFRLRARVRADRAYPYANGFGYSRSVRVRVR